MGNAANHHPLSKLSSRTALPWRLKCQTEMTQTRPGPPGAPGSLGTHMEKQCGQCSGLMGALEPTLRPGGLTEVLAPRVCLLGSLCSSHQLCKEHDSGVRETWVLILAPLLTNGVASDKPVVFPRASPLIC